MLCIGFIETYFDGRASRRPRCSGGARTRTCKPLLAVANIWLFSWKDTTPQIYGFCFSQTWNFFSKTSYFFFVSWKSPHFSVLVEYILFYWKLFLKIYLFFSQINNFSIKSCKKWDPPKKLKIPTFFLWLKRLFSLNLSLKTPDIFLKWRFSPQIFLIFKIFWGWNRPYYLFHQNKIIIFSEKSFFFPMKMWLFFLENYLKS